MVVIQGISAGLSDFKYIHIEINCCAKVCFEPL